jgi:glutamyl-tRNA synthetase
VSSGYREKGYLPEAVVNFLALLGWNPGNDQEIMTMDEMIRLFDLSKCSKAGARFDYIKGMWFNHQYLLMRDPMDWTPEFDRILKAEGIESTPEREAQVVEMMKMKVIEYTDSDNNKKKRNISFVSDLWPLCKFFFVAPETYNAEDKFVRKNWNPGTALEMDELIGVLSALDAHEFTVAEMKDMVESWCEATGRKPWNAWRVALVGTGQGPDMYELAAFLGKEETIRRMQKAIETLG